MSGEMHERGTRARALPPSLSSRHKTQAARKLRESLSIVHRYTQAHIHRPSSTLCETQYTHTQIYDAHSAKLTQTDTLTQRRFNEPSCVRARRERGHSRDTAHVYSTHAQQTQRTRSAHSAHTLSTLSALSALSSAHLV